MKNAESAEFARNFGSDVRRGDFGEIVREDLENSFMD